MSVLGKRWQLKNSDPQASLLQKLLQNRGLREEQDIEAFFQPTLARDFHDPFLMEDMERVVARIGQAIEKNERIMIFGDYDVDGITGTAILMRALRRLGANVSFRLPHRIEDGYGLRPKFIEEFGALGVKLAITVDNGISCWREVELANERGIDMIISDHHTIPERIPNAFAILHPKLPKTAYPFRELTGAGVALKIAQALFMRRLSKSGAAEEETENLLDLACMGTIADVGELRGENRYIVKEGLRVLENTRWPGLSRLKEFAGIKGKINVHDIGFLLSPRINAAGRISHPKHALQLLLHDQDEVGRVLAENLEQLNRKRQGMMEELFEIALALAEEQKNDPAIVLYRPEFHGGIIGLIAAKLSERYCRPAIIMEQRSTTCVASCRSIPSVNMVEALTELHEMLINFGGHAAAAGFEIETSRVAEFSVALKEQVARQAKPQAAEALLTIECELSAPDISQKTLDMLQWFEPFGMGNEVPRFLFRDLKVQEVKLIGADKKHLKLTLDVDGKNVDALGWRMGEFARQITKNTPLSIVGELEENEWNGKKKVQLKIVDLRL